MDINEIKKHIQDKIYSDKLKQKVRTVIQEKKWEKQDLKEGFKESFKPLIKPQLELNEQIKERNEENNKQIKQIQENQLALTEGLAANRLALTEGLQTMANLLAIEQDRETEEQDRDFLSPDIFEDARDIPQPGSSTGAIPKKIIPKPITLNPENHLTPAEINQLVSENFERPNNLIDKSEEELNELLKRTNKEIQFSTGKLVGIGKKKQKNKKDKEEIEQANQRKRIFKNYKKVIEASLLSLPYQTGKGIYFSNPHQLLNRLDLLAGSILAGNNGVIPEFTQLVHFLNQMNIISKKQLNNLLKSYIKIR